MIEESMLGDGLFNTWFAIGIEVLIVVLCLSLLICFVRLYKGPTPSNRIVAFDLIAIHAVGIMALFAVQSGETVLLDAAIITAVLGFLGTVMLAFFLEQADSSEWRNSGEE